MQLTSPAFEHEGSIPSKYTCDGDNISPTLQIADVPEGTKALVLLMDDPDVPKTVRADGMWDHWVVFNMPPETTTLLEGTIPPGVQGANTRGNQAYSGPCPPDREHRYFFKLYAIDVAVDLPAGSSKKEVEQAMEGHVVAEATLMGKYKMQ